MNTDETLALIAEIQNMSVIDRHLALEKIINQCKEDDAPEVLKAIYALKRI